MNSPVKAAGSVSGWISGAKQGDQEAAARLWQRYRGRLRGLIQRHLRGVKKRAADADDVLQNVFMHFFCGAKEQRFPDLKNRDDLWGLLIVISSREAWKQRQYENRKKRGGGKVRGESVFEHPGAEKRGRGLEQAAADPAPPPDEIAERLDSVDRLLEKLPESLGPTAALKLFGYTDKEIACLLGWNVRTIERKLATIRAVLRGEQQP